MLSVAKWLRLRLRSQRPEFYSRLSWCFYKWIKYEIKCKHTDLYKKNILKLQHGLCVITRNSGKHLEIIHIISLSQSHSLWAISVQYLCLNLGQCTVGQGNIWDSVLWTLYKRFSPSNASLFFTRPTISMFTVVLSFLLLL